MKLQPRSIDAFLKSPPEGCNTVLIFGADNGLVRVRRDTLLSAWGINKADPFCYTELTIAAIEDNPSVLYEALCAMTLTGDAPCVVVTDATDKFTALLKDAQSNPAASNRLIIMAGELPARSTLRAYAEDAKSKERAAIACYRDEGAGLAQLIRQFMQEKGIRAAPQVMQTLTSLLGNDRAVTMKELEKIDLYLGKERELNEEAILLLLADNQHMMMSDAVMAWFAGDMAAFYRLSDRIFAEGESPVAIIRIVLSVAGRLLAIQQAVAAGMTQEQAIQSLKPPIFFKDAPLYQQALRRWSLSALLHLHQALQRLEAEVKLAGAFGECLLQHELQQLHLRAAKL